MVGLLYPFLLMAATLAAQEAESKPAPEPPAQGQPAGAPTKENPQPGAPPTRTAIDVKPGKPTIKTPEIGHEPIGPISRLPKYILEDQKAIWTSPFRSGRQNARYWAIFGAAAGILISQDHRISQALPNSNDQRAAGAWGSRIGAAYSLLPISAGIYFLGSGTKDERLRETGILAFEALASTTIIETVLKAATRRERPLEADGHGHFFSNQGSVWNASFPSGHAINSFALASVIAHEYKHKKIVPILAYTLAGTVVLSRMAAQRHFASDVVVGSAMGWFTGTYIYGKRHSQNLDRPSIVQRIFSHVQIGAYVGP
jgi:membrane-associated phospholipid phosphatase